MNSNEWDSLSSSYSSWIRGGPHRGRALYGALTTGICDLVPDNVNSIADLGCGDGSLLKALSRSVQMTGVDFSPEMLQRASENIPGLTVVQADLGAPLPLQSGAYDIVICSMVLMYLSSLGPVMQEIRRILAFTPRAGKAIVAVPHPCFFNRRESLRGYEYFNEIIYEKTLDASIPERIWHAHRTLSSYSAAFRRAGLAISSIVETRVTPNEAVESEMSQYRVLPVHCIFELIPLPCHTD